MSWTMAITSAKKIGNNICLILRITFIVVYTSTTNGNNISHSSFFYGWKHFPIHLLVLQNLQDKHFLQTWGSSQQWAKACLSLKSFILLLRKLSDTSKYFSFVFKYSKKKTVSSDIRIYPLHSITLVPTLTVSWTHSRQYKVTNLLGKLPKAAKIADTTKFSYYHPSGLWASHAPSASIIIFIWYHNFVEGHLLHI